MQRYTQRLGPLARLPQVLRELGADPTQVFDKARLDWATMDPETRIPFERAVELLSIAARMIGCSHIGLLLGNRAEISDFGVAGELLSSAPNLREALTAFVSLQPSHSGGAVVYLANHGEDWLLGYGAYRHEVPDALHIYDVSLAVAWRLVNVITSGAALPVEVLISHNEPAHRQPYDTFFKAPVRFNEAHSGLVYPRAAMDLPIVTADQDKYEMLLARVRQNQLAAQPYANRVRHLLRPLLLTQKASMSNVAEALQVSPRVLRNRLADENTTFEKIRDEVRCAIAMELLHLTEMPMNEIANAISFAHHSTFDRAFLRWTGIKPTQFRATGINRQSILPR